MKKNYYMSIDCEYGGIGDAMSLLSSAFVMFSDDETYGPSLILNTKPNDGIYKVSGSGLAVNKINLVDHDKKALTEKEAGTELYKFLKECYQIAGGRIIPVGHGVAGDIRKIKSCLISEGSWNSFFSYTSLDTAAISQYLKVLGKIPEDVDLGVESLLIHFGISYNPTMLHEAYFDALMVRHIFEKMKAL